MLYFIFLFCALIAQNQTATYTKEYEQNEHTINAIYLKWHSASLRNDSITARNALAYKSDIAMLKSIAAQCPYSGGNAVFAARAILAQYDKTYYDDKALCLEQGILWRTGKPKANKVEDNTKVKFYPNPASDYGTLSFSGKHSDYIVRFIDLLGRVVLTQNVGSDVNTVVLPFGQTAEGIYILNISNTKNEQIFQQKVIIIKP
jgi:hypothetical protein